MDSERKPLSLLELCVWRVIDNLRYVGSVDGVGMHLLKRILPHCTLDQLTRIESRTEMDLSPVTDVLWKRFYQRQFGEEHTNDVIQRMKRGGVCYQWKDLFKAKTEKQKEVEDKMVEKLTKKYQAEKAGDPLSKDSVTAPLSSELSIVSCPITRALARRHNSASSSPSLALWSQPFGMSW